MAIDFNYLDRVINKIAEQMAGAVELAYRLHLGHDDELTDEEVKANAKVIIDRQGRRHYYWGANPVCSIVVTGDGITIMYDSAVPIAIKTQEQLDKLPITRIQERKI